MLAAALTFVLGSCLTAKASITLQLTDATSKAEAGFVATVPTGTLAANELIGIYEFSASGLGPATLWSTCTSPLGVLDWSSHTYVLDGFSAASPGHNPASWAAGTEGDAGIQNAQYLWRLFSPTIIAGGNANQGAALELAMWEALYDSTSYGVLGGTSFKVTTWATADAQTDYNTYLAALNFTSVDNDLGLGSILRDSLYDSSGGRQTTPGAGQDFIYNVTPVPEPATMVAGALLLLPFGASTLRMLRKNRSA